MGGPSSGQLEISSLLWGRYVDFLWSRSRANLAFESSVSVVSVHLWFENKIGKSELVPVGDVLNVDALAGILWFKVAKWDIWREGNMRTFERNERSIYDLKPSFFQLCWAGKCFWGFCFQFFAWVALFFYFRCYLVCILCYYHSTLPVCFGTLYFLMLFQWSFLLKKKVNKYWRLKLLKYYWEMKSLK